MINMGYCGDNIASYGPEETDKSDWNICRAPAGSSGHYAIPEISRKKCNFPVVYDYDGWWTGDESIDTTLIVMWFYDDLTVFELIYFV